MEGSVTDTNQRQAHPSSQVGFVYKPCTICEDVRKSFACVKCMKQDQYGFLILREGRLRKDDHHLLYSWSLQENIKQIRYKVAEHEAKEKLLEAYREKTRQAHLENAVQRCSGNVERLKKLLLSRRLEVKKQEQRRSESTKLRHASQSRVNKLIQRKAAMLEYIKNKENSVKKNLSKAESLNVDLHQRKKELVCLLITYIFPIKQIDPGNSDELQSGDAQADTDGEINQVREQIDEARRTSFVCGRWVDQQVLSSDHVRISVGVDEASAPSDGNYSQYEAWLEGNAKQSSSDPLTSPATSSLTSSANSLALRHLFAHNSVASIGAALCHATQMIHVLRKLLGVHLPHQVHYRTFCNSSISPRVFANSVKLLNSNIVTLCLQQGVDGLTLHAQQTLRNLKVLTDLLQTEGLRDFPYIPSAEAITYMEECLTMSDISDDELDRTNDDANFDWHLSLDNDWENVATSDVKGFAIVQSSRESSQAPSPPSYTSIDGQSSLLSNTSELVASTLAWAKGFWGQGAE